MEILIDFLTVVGGGLITNIIWYKIKKYFDADDQR